MAAALYITGSCGRGAVLPPGAWGWSDERRLCKRVQFTRDLGTHNLARAIRQHSV